MNIALERLLKYENQELTNHLLMWGPPLYILQIQRTIDSYTVLSKFHRTTNLQLLEYLTIQITIFLL